MKKKKRRIILLIGIILVTLLTLAVLCRLFWLQPFRDTARCMEPTVKKGDLVLVNKLSYRVSEPKRGDIVLIDTARLPINPKPRHKRWIKRVIGVPGDRVSIRPPHVYINGAPLTTPAIFSTISEKKKGYRAYTLPDTAKFPNAVLKSDTDEITLSSNEYFLLGDNPALSLDSRHFGPASRTVILGRVNLKYKL
jgi:signal peptidase I